MALVEFSVDGLVAQLRLNRPPVNAISEELAQALVSAFERCTDPTIRAVVVTGVPHFAAGADIKGFVDTYRSGTEEKTASALRNAVSVLESLEKPTIAAVRGFALGGGLELALGADFRYLATDSKVGQPEIKLGLIPGAGGTQRLQRVVGFQRAKEIIYSGRHVDAAEALEIGLADKVVDPEDLLHTAMEDAQRWAETATLGIAAARRALLAGTGMTLNEGLEIEGREFDRAFATEDGREGVFAFVEKRRPEFKGR